MNYSYIISQIFAILAYALLGVTYLTKKKNLILLLNALSTISFTVSYIFLFAWSGVKMNMISLVRNLIFYLVARFASNSKNWKIVSLAIVYLLIGADVILCLSINRGIFVFGSIFDVVPYIATAIYTFAIWNEKGKMYKYFGIMSSIAWIVYNTFIRSLFGVILETVMVICAIVGLVKQKRIDMKDTIHKGEI